MGHSQARIARQIGGTVRRLRSQRGQAQRQVAHLAGITRAALSAYERGEEAPTPEILERLLAALGCTEEHFARHFGPFGEVESLRLKAERVQ